MKGEGRWLESAGLREKAFLLLCLQCANGVISRAYLHAVLRYGMDFSPQLTGAPEYQRKLKTARHRIPQSLDALGGALHSNEVRTHIIIPLFIWAA